MMTTATVRYNWIDWGKSIGIFLVLCEHTPIVPEYDYIHGFLRSFHMPLFLLISGFLYKERVSIKEEIRKDLTTLITPYLIYQVLFYPYWYFREVIAGDEGFSAFKHLLSPFIQSVLSEPINGPTWFIFSLFFTRIYAHWILKNKKYATLGITISCLCAIAICLGMNNRGINGTYAAYHFAELSIFFFLGYWFKKSIDINALINNRTRCIFLFLICTVVCVGANSLITEIRYTTIYSMILFYIAGISGSMIIISISFILNHVSNKLIYNLSIGTLIILGLHWMVIGTLNFVMEKALHITNITYPPLVTFIIALGITLGMYPIILFCKKHIPILMGNRS